MNSVNFQILTGIASGMISFFVPTCCTNTTRREQRKWNYRTKGTIDRGIKLNVKMLLCTLQT